MNKPNLVRTPILSTAAGILLGILLASATSSSVRAQGELASGTVSGSGSGPYNYALTFSDAVGGTNIGSIWYAWVPGQFYLPSVPSSPFAPAGWTANVSSRSIQFVATSSIYDITAGGSLSGFGYSAPFSPATLASTPNSGTSVAYSAGLLSDSGDQFTVQQVPEPSATLLILSGCLGLYSARRRSL